MAARVAISRGGVNFSRGGVKFSHPVHTHKRPPDPTHTVGLRLAFMRHVNRLWNELKRDMRESIVANDCLGIAGFMERERRMNERAGLAAIPRRPFGFETKARHIDRFMTWLEEQEAAGILSTSRLPGRGLPDWARRTGAFRGVGAARASWADVYIDSAYMAGIRQKRLELRAAGVPVVPDESFVGGITAVFNQPIHAEAVAEVYSRTYEHLKTATTQMNADARRIVAEGLRTGLAKGVAEGRHPNQVAGRIFRDLAGRVDVTRSRCRMIARTEMIRAHHVASMTEYTEAERILGEPLMLDWVFGGGPCPNGICIDHAENGPYTRAEFPELPAHPN